MGERAAVSSGLSLAEASSGVRRCRGVVVGLTCETHHKLRVVRSYPPSESSDNSARETRHLSNPLVLAQ